MGEKKRPKLQQQRAYPPSSVRASLASPHSQTLSPSLSTTTTQFSFFSGEGEILLSSSLRSVGGAAMEETDSNNNNNNNTPNQIWSKCFMLYTIMLLILLVFLLFCYFLCEKFGCESTLSLSISQHFWHPSEFFIFVCKRNLSFTAVQSPCVCWWVLHLCNLICG